MLRVGSWCAAALAGVIAFAPAAAASAAPAARAEPALATDPVRSDQHHLDVLRATDAWTFAQGEGVTVAVVDSGVDAGHPDLAGQVLPGLDLVDGSGKGDTDPVGHGTTVAAIIAGRSDDSAGVVGLAPKAKILPVRVLDDHNRYDDALVVARAVRWAVDNGARVVNLSLGGNGSSPALAAALDYAFAKDVVVVACTGNLNGSSAEPTGVWYPAREPGVIAVAGLERDGKTLWSGSITGKETVISAPATELVGARPGDYWKVQGTSFAAPMVTATAALIRSRWPTMPAGEVVNRLIRTAGDLGGAGRDASFGFGIVNPVAALTADVPAVFDNPLDTAPPPGVAGFGNAPAAGESSPAPEPTNRQRAEDPPASNGGGWAVPGTAISDETGHGGWIAVLLFALSAAAGALTLRRFRQAAD